MDGGDDILVEIPCEELLQLRDFYGEAKPFPSHVFSFVNTGMKWMRKAPERQLIKFFAPKGDWRRDGTIVILMQWSSCYDIFVYTLEESCERLEHALKTTKRFDWTRTILFYAVHRKHHEAVFRAMETIKANVDHGTKTDFWWMPKEKAAQLAIDCPEEYVIEVLRPEHADIINEIWPHRYPGSEDYLRVFIEMNGGHGVFTKEDGRLVSWVLKNPMGTLGILQTIDEYKRKGLGSIITKSLSKEIALEGHDPLGTVVFGNTASQNMFRGIGFEPNDWCMYIQLN